MKMKPNKERFRGRLALSKREPSNTKTQVAMAHTPRMTQLLITWAGCTCAIRFERSVTGCLSECMDHKCMDHNTASFQKHLRSLQISLVPKAASHRAAERKCRLLGRHPYILGHPRVLENHATQYPKGKD